MLARGGLGQAVAKRLGLEPPTPARRVIKVSLLVILTWLPLVILSVLSGHAWQRPRRDPALARPGRSHPLSLRRASARARADRRRDEPARADAPLPRLRSDSRATARPEYKAVVAEITRLRNAPHRGKRHHHPGRLLLGSAYERWETCACTVRAGSAWAGSLTPAGWWYILVSLPVLYFFLFCWAWLFLLWAWFLFRVSRLAIRADAHSP